MFDTVVLWLQSPAEVWSILYISEGGNEIIPQRFDLLLTGVTPLLPLHSLLFRLLTS